MKQEAEMANTKGTDVTLSRGSPHRLVRWFACHGHRRRRMDRARRMMPMLRPISDPMISCDGLMYAAGGTPPVVRNV